MIVALHPEGVDRNKKIFAVLTALMVSPSTRRAWIEIDSISQIFSSPFSRPPPGGRG